MWLPRLVALLMGLMASMIPAHAGGINPSVAQDRTAPWMRVFGVTQPPFGFVEFCQRDAAECRDGPIEDQRRQGNKDELAELERLNRTINKDVVPVSDQDLYGVTEYWTLPIGMKGDCEDYVLLKRHRLMAAGWPASSLLITVVLDEKSEGHAILTVRTVSGDFILDNKNDEIKLWHKTPYRFVMRQSYLNPKIWMSLDPKEAAPSVPMAGMRNAARTR